MSTHRKRKKQKKLAVFCGVIAFCYFLGFFLIHFFDLGTLLPEDWISNDWHYIIASFSIICFLLYATTVVRIYNRQSIPNPKYNIYSIFGAILMVLFVLWIVSLLMRLLKI